MTIGIKNRHLIENQVPYHIREQNPKFVKFLEYYYEFLEESKINDLIQDIRKYNDIDEVEETFLREFFEEFRSLPYSIIADKRLVAKHIYDLYKSKGSEDALKLLFRIAFNENILVSYPSENILRASDGRWIQEKLVIISITDGTFDSLVNRLVFSNTAGEFTFRINRILIDASNRYSVYFDAKTDITVNNNQAINFYRDAQYKFSGETSAFPTKVDIIDGGAYWQVGQIFTLPGSNKDTICQVNSIGFGGNVTKVDILEYGDGYNFNDVYVLSPLNYIPTENYSDSYTVTETGGNKNHFLTVQDYSNGIKDNFYATDIDTGITSDPTEYTSVENITSNVATYPTHTGYVDEFDITISNWLNSRAKFILRGENYATTAGYYDGYQGLINFPEIRLQDNFFYQVFSYVIDTIQLLKNFSGVISLIHPAGTKYFTNFTKQKQLVVETSVTRLAPTYILDLIDSVAANESIAKYFTKGLVDSTTTSETFYREFEGTINLTSDATASTTGSSLGYDAQNYDAEEYTVTIPLASQQENITFEVTLTGSSSASSQSSAGITGVIEANGSIAATSDASAEGDVLYLMQGSSDAVSEASTEILANAEQVGESLAIASLVSQFRAIATFVGSSDGISSATAYPV